MTHNTVLVLNGDVPHAQVFHRWKEQGYTIVAADGAANTLLRYGVIPHLVVGDMDSFAVPPPHGAGIELVRDASQDTNDFEKCLNVMAERGISAVLICGLQGGELEHTLNNWSVLRKYVHRFSFRLYDGSRVGYVQAGCARYSVSPGDTISIIPFFHARLRTEGLRWELTGEVLAMGVREGARNQAIAATVSIDVQEGLAIVFTGE